MVLNSRRYSHALKNSAVLLTPQSLALRYHWHRRVLLRGIIDIAESCSAVSLTPQSLAPRYNWHRRVKLSGVIEICIAKSWPICAWSGVGVGLAREAATLMVGQYFKRRREVVEVMLVASSGLGVTLILSFINPVLRLVPVNSIILMDWTDLWMGVVVVKNNPLRVVLYNADLTISYQQTYVHPYNSKPRKTSSQLIPPHPTLQHSSSKHCPKHNLISASEPCLSRLVRIQWYLSGCHLHMYI